MRPIRNPLVYVNEAVSLLLDHDALVVIAPGLGIHGILLEFLREFHIQNGCHPGNNVHRVAIQGELRVEPPKTQEPPKGRLVGSPPGAEMEPIEPPQGGVVKSKGNCVSSSEEIKRKIGSRLILLLNTSDEEARVIKARAEMMNLANNSWFNQHEDERFPKKRKLNKDQHEEGPSSLIRHSNPFVEDSPVQLSFYIHTPSGQADLPEQRQLEYSKGGIFVIKSRLLVTDILCGRLPPESIDGIVVNHAEK